MESAAQTTEMMPAPRRLISRPQGWWGQALAVFAWLTPDPGLAIPIKLPIVELVPVARGSAKTTAGRSPVVG